MVLRIQLKSPSGNLQSQDTIAPLQDRTRTEPDPPPRTWFGNDFWPRGSHKSIPQTRISVFDMG
jgi:hypothetical protein